MIDSGINRGVVQLFHGYIIPKCGKYIVVYFWSIKKKLFCSIREIQSKPLFAARWTVRMRFYLICNGSGESIQSFNFRTATHREWKRTRARATQSMDKCHRQRVFFQVCVLILLRFTIPSWISPDYFTTSTFAFIHIHPLRRASLTSFRNLRSSDDDNDGFSLSLAMDSYHLRFRPV